MATHGSPVVGVFDERAMAEQALEALHDAGFSDSEISYSGTTSGEGFFAGLKKLFTGDEENAGTVENDLVNMGVPQDQAEYYANEHQAGRPVVAVRAEGRTQEALDILRSSGGYDYSSRSSGRVTNTNSTTTTTGTYADRTDRDQPGYTTNAATDRSTYTTDTNTDPNTYATGTNVDQTAYTDRTGGTADYANETDTLRLREERLQAEKNSVQSGEVRLHKDVVSEEKTIDVPVTHEEVVIERRSGSGQPVTGAEIGQDETIRVPVSEEQVNINKNTVETGEVAIGKRAVTENQRVSDTVRREEARLERDGDVNVQGNTDNVRDSLTDDDTRR